MRILSFYICLAIFSLSNQALADSCAERLIKDGVVSSVAVYECGTGSKLMGSCYELLRTRGVRSKSFALEYCKDIKRNAYDAFDVLTSFGVDLNYTVEISKKVQTGFPVILNVLVNDGVEIDYAIEVSNNSKGSFLSCYTQKVSNGWNINAAIDNCFK